MFLYFCSHPSWDRGKLAFTPSFWGVLFVFLQKHFFFPLQKGERWLVSQCLPFFFLSSLSLFLSLSLSLSLSLCLSLALSLSISFLFLVSCFFLPCFFCSFLPCFFVVLSCLVSFCLRFMKSSKDYISKASFHEFFLFIFLLFCFVFQIPFLFIFVFSLFQLCVLVNINVPSFQEDYSTGKRTAE